MLPLRVNASGHLSINLLPISALSAMAVTTESAGHLVSSRTVNAGAEAITVGSARDSQVAPSPSGDSSERTAPPPAGQLSTGSREAIGRLTAGQKSSSTVDRPHRTNGHQGASRLRNLLSQAGSDDAVVMAAIERVCAACVTCQSLAPRPPRSVVTPRRASAFNDTVALDVADVPDRGAFVHIIDLGTRLSQAAAIPDKLWPTIVRAFLDRWICIYGAPRCALSDNGRKFRHVLVRTLGERFNLRITVTAAQS